MSFYEQFLMFIFTTMMNDDINVTTFYVTKYSVKMTFDEISRMQFHVTKSQELIFSCRTIM